MLAARKGSEVSLRDAYGKLGYLFLNFLVDH